MPAACGLSGHGARAYSVHHAGTTAGAGLVHAPAAGKMSDAMTSIGDVHVYVSDFSLALRFYEDGLGLSVAESEVGQAASFAVLESPEGGPALRLFSGAEPWCEGERPEVGSRPTVRFDVVTTEFDSLLVRLIEHGGRQLGATEEYNGTRVTTVADPDGNTFELVEIRESTTSDSGD